MNSAAQPAIIWDDQLIKRHDLSGPRYTSYPTALQFDDALASDQLMSRGLSSCDSDAPLSLYVHIPFCAHVCYYCACNKVITSNRRRAQPYLDTLYQEMAFLADKFSQGRRVDQLHWGGGTPTFISKQQMTELMGMLAKHFKLRDDDKGDYALEIDPRECDTSTLDHLRELGFNRISLGIQDIDPEVQIAVNRQQSTEHTALLINHARSLGFRSINVDLIYGLPHQTPERFEKTVEQVIQMSPDRLSVFNYAHMPDRFRSQRHIAAETLPNPSEKLTILHNTIEQLLAAGYQYIGMDHFAKPEDPLAQAQRNGQLHRNFQGYTTHSDCDLIAMGVSAISQIGDVYYQNAHDILAYTQAVEQTNHAIKRGVSLTEDDRIRRAVIGQLICHFELDTDLVGKQLKINFDEYFSAELTQLKTFAEEGLIERSANKFIVSAAGRLLIRRLCMVFDQYSKPSHAAGKFSKII